jgi:hypothetical protein
MDKIVARSRANNQNVKKPVNCYRFNLNNVRPGTLYFQPENKIHGLLTIRLFSTSYNREGAASRSGGARASNMPSSNLKVFSNADLDKLDIFEYVKGKSGIYM